MDINNIFDLLSQFAPNFKVMNLNVSPDVQMEYFKLQQEEQGKMTIEEFHEKKDSLLDEVTPLDERKFLLTRFSLIDDVEVMRMLEKYAVDAPEDIKDFATMAAYQSKLLLEASLLGENQVVIASGLGGDENRIRFFIAVLALDNKPLSEVEQQLVQNEFTFLFKNNDVTLEKIEFEDYYAKMLALVPINVNVKELVLKGIDACNEIGEFLNTNMVISTTKYYNKEDLDAIVEEKELGMDGDIFGGDIEI